MKKETKLIKERAKQYREASKNPANSKIRQEVYVLLAKEAERCAEICENPVDTIKGRFSYELKRTEKTTKQISLELDVPKDTVKAWYSGESFPVSIEKCNAVCDFYGLDKMYVYTGERRGYRRPQRVKTTARQRFAQALLETGLSPNEIATKLDTNRKYVDMWINKGRMPRIDDMRRICVKLGLDELYVFTGVKEDENEG